MAARSTAARAAVAVVLMQAVAAACGGPCDGSRLVFAGPLSTPPLDGNACACELVFQYSEGATPGTVSITLPDDVALGAAVFDSVAEDALPVAQLRGFSDATVSAATGMLRVVFSAPPAGRGVAVTAEAINVAPVVQEVLPPGVEQIDSGLIIFNYIPYGVPTPVPVEVSDPDNWDQGLVVDMNIVTLAGSEQAMSLLAAPVEGVSFDVGTPGEPVQRLVLSGPGRLVEEAVRSTVLRPYLLTPREDSRFSVLASDGLTTTTFIRELLTVPAGHMVVTAASQQLNSGTFFLPSDVHATWLVVDAVKIVVEGNTLGENAPSAATPCHDYIRVYDGPSPDAGRLLSTDLVGTGEICRLQGQTNLPEYLSLTGRFFVELVSGPDSNQAQFHAYTQPVPEGGFQVWMLSGDTQLSVAGPTVVPQVMVSGIDIAADFVEITVTATAGSVGIRFAASFRDVIDAASTPRTLVLSLFDSDKPPMLRLGQVLANLLYTPPAGFEGDDQVVVEARTAAGAATPLVLAISVALTAIDVPEHMQLHAFQPTRLGVTTSAPSLTVSTSTGIGQVTLDHRALDGIDAGYADSLTASSSSLEHLTYYATLGGTDVVRLEADDGSVAEIAITVDPECNGSHFIYAREGSFTDRAGPEPFSVPYDPELECTWVLTGPNRLSFPQWDIHRLSGVTVLDATGLLFTNLFRPEPPATIASPTGSFIVSLGAFGFSAGGLVGVFDLAGDADNARNVVSIPREGLQVVRGTETLLPALYVNGFDDRVLTVSISTSLGSLNTPGTRLVQLSGQFAEIDPLMGSMLYLAEQQGTAELILQDLSGSTVFQYSFSIDVVPCQGLAEIKIDPADVGSSARVEDGSGIADYSAGLSCQWRLTGAPAPAVLDLDYLRTECGRDEIKIRDGADRSGTLLGSFCREGDVAAEIGRLVSTSGAFFIEWATDSETALEGFSAVYQGLPSGSQSVLTGIPLSLEPVRVGAAMVHLPGTDRLLVVGGSNGIRPLHNPIVYSTSSRTWEPVVDAGSVQPNQRIGASMAALDATRVVMAGGMGPFGNVWTATWYGELTGNTMAWTWLGDVPEITSFAVRAVNGGAYLLGVDGVWSLSETGSWEAMSPERQPRVVPTSSAVVGGGMVAAGADGDLWRLDVASQTWTTLGIAMDAPCSVEKGCAGAMLDTEYVAVLDDGSAIRTNLTSGAVRSLAFNAAGGASVVGAAFQGKPSLYVFSEGQLAVVTMTLAVDGVSPRVSPVGGGTIVRVAGDQLTECADPRCVFGDAEAPAAVLSGAHIQCETAPGAGDTVMQLGCGEALYRVDDVLLYFDEPEIVSTEPRSPNPGDFVLIELGGVRDAVLSTAAAPLCRFDDEVVTAQLDGSTARCRVPEDAERGATLELRISLDGQQFGASSAPVTVDKGSTREPFVDKSRATIAGLILAAVVFVFAASLHLRSPKRVARPAIFAVALALVDVYFDVVFASKLRDEGSSLWESSFSLLAALVVMNLALVIGVLMHKMRLSGGRHAFVRWLAEPGAVLAVSLCCLLGLIRVSAVALLMTRLGGLRMFDAEGMSDKDWHRLAALDIGSAVVEDLGQLVIQLTYLTGGGAEVDVVTIVTVGLSVTMVLYALFQSTARLALMGALRRQKSGVVVTLPVESR